MGGYVTRVLHKRLTNSKHKMKTELCTCLLEINDISPDEMCDDSDDWMNLIEVAFCLSIKFVCGAIQSHKQWYLILTFR